MPPTPDQTAYEVLDIPRSATQDEIKKRYRELARKLHPDVNQDNPSASRQFSAVTQAYKTLSDLDSRRLYDAELTLKDQRAKQAAARAAQSAAPPQAAHAAAQNRARPASGSNNLADSARLTGDARSAFLRDRPVEARTLAEQAIRLNGRNADAWEVLGDVFRRQGRNEEAMNAYSMSLQINPRNPSVMQRLERMAKAAGPATPAGYNSRPSPRPGAPAGSVRSGGAGGNPYTGAGSGYGQRPTGYPASAQGRYARLQDPDKRPLRQILINLVGYGCVMMLIFYAAIYPGDAPLSFIPFLAWVSHWNATIVTLLGLCGLITGATMTISGAIRRIDDELILAGVSGGGGSFLPLGLLLIVLSVLNFYVAALVYAAVTAIQESFTKSMVRVFCAVFAVTALLSATYTPSHLQVFLFGGNVVFITFVIGWLLGDFFRSDIG
jgi:tetratricopeptide (TPR) repeat protein